MQAPDESTQPVTLRTLQKRMNARRQFAMLTCYDATTAQWLAQGGVDVLLVGDTAAEMILGHESTIHAPLDFMLQITAAVKRGAPNSFVMGDMPFMSYQADGAEAVRNAGRFLTEGFADAVKLEVGRGDAELIDRLSRAGIPVVAHLGSRPQHIRRTGGYRAAGKTAADAVDLVEQARLMERCGAAMLLLEATTAEASERVVDAVSIPVIGCGAGPACHGHVIVLHDLLGLTRWQPPFAEPRAAAGEAITRAASKWVEQVESGSYLRDEHPYVMREDERRKLQEGGTD